ncbi:YciK family oxidoreductase [Alteromonas sediminis]|uniref:YciK family oxidoreductase n=1 Tax=Alteromonas sediminis TaxID=2259342 RepID=A0A3N5Y365_9ALTE|nr:YciK family oxidoreductase [Alteromonas sediminis]RPJ67563.1 YciK family oxidoreductase [Alteromonas sediminis]
MVRIPSNNSSLDQKIILITGAGDGIGKQAALTFAEMGATCILLGRTVSKLEATYDSIVQAGGLEPAIVPLDMNGATHKHYLDMNTTILSEYGRLDGCLHNASVLGNLCPFNEIKPEEWQEVLQVNLTASAFMTQALIPSLKAAEHASVVFTSSGVGRQGRAFWGTYAVSKFATEGMMQVLADEYKNAHIRFNCINPGATRTAMRAKAFPAEDVTTLKTPADIMPTYSFMMSDESIGINGQSINC